MGIGNGEFHDIDSIWYARVGSAFCMTMMLNVFTPNILTWLRLCCCDAAKRKRMREIAVTQKKLNESYSGAIFKLEYRYPTVLNVIFVTMLYSSGMPILYPIAAVTFGVMYITDKVALLRLYNRPPMYKASLARLTLNILPIAIVFHLCMAVWMYGSNTLASHPLSYHNTTYTLSLMRKQAQIEFLAGNNTAAENVAHQFNIVSRIEKLNGFIPFFLLLCIVIYFILKFLVWWWVVWATECFIKIISCGKCGIHSRVAPERKFLPGYTEPHVMYVGDIRGMYLTTVEKEQGWICKQNEDGVLQRYKVWMEDGDMTGLRHERGTKKATWEVIRDTALHTYDISENPNYSDAFGGARRRSIGGAAVGASLGAGGGV